MVSMFLVPAAADTTAATWPGRSQRHYVAGGQSEAGPEPMAGDKWQGRGERSEASRKRERGYRRQVARGGQ